MPVWEKLVYLATFAAFTGAARKPAGAIWGDAIGREAFLDVAAEVEAVARAEGVPIAADVIARMIGYLDALPPDTRSSLLIDLQQGKPTEVEALQGEVVRRGRGPRRADAGDDRALRRAARRDATSRERLANPA